MREQQSSPVGVGVITIITVLLVLCLSIFSALTLTSAKADHNLSLINAETVSAYYEADAEAARLAADFISGTDPELEQTIIIPDGRTAAHSTGNDRPSAQSLYIHLVRRADGSIQVLAWQAIPDGGDFDLDDGHLSVWDGQLP